MPRVVSLLPSATELVCALGARDELVGVSHECDWPADVVGLPVLTRSRLDPTGTSAGIDRDVRRVLQDALTVYEVDVEGLGRARPDVIVTQDLCEVCAVSLSDVTRALEQLAGPEVRLVNLHPTRLEHVWDDLRRVGAALGRERAAEEAVAEGRGRLQRLAERVAPAAARPATLTIEWLDPVMVGGTWMPELVHLAGGRALVTEPGQHAPTLDADALAALDPAPEVVLVKPCGFPLGRVRDEWEVLRRVLVELDWPAVADGRVYLSDGSAFFNRPGPRLVESAEILAACLHPELVPDLVARHGAHLERVDPASASAPWAG